MLKPEGGSLVPSGPTQYFMRYCDHNQRYELFTEEQRKKIVDEYHSINEYEWGFKKLNMVTLGDQPYALWWKTEDGYYIPYTELPACSC